MTSRNAARRRRGSHRPRRQYPRPTGETAALLQSWRMSPSAKEAMADWRHRLERNGASFVYFVQGRDGGPVKIGVAIDPLARMRELQVGNPAELYLAEVILGVPETEDLLHRHWLDARLRGEWFGNGCEEAILAVASEISKRQRTTPHREMGYRDVMTTLVWRILNEAGAA